MKTRKLNFDAFRANQLTSIQQKSINGGVGPNGEPDIPPFEDFGDEGEPEWGGPTNQQNTAPSGSIRNPVVPIVVVPIVIAP